MAAAARIEDDPGAENFTPTAHQDLGESITLHKLLELCLRENDRRLAPTMPACGARGWCRRWRNLPTACCRPAFKRNSIYLRAQRARREMFPLRPAGRAR